MAHHPVVPGHGARAAPQPEALVDAAGKVAGRAQTELAGIVERVRGSPVVHADETGWREGDVNGGDIMDRDVGIAPPGLNTGVGELAALDLGVAGRVAGLLVPAGADVAVGCHVSIIPFSARGSQEPTVSIPASGVKRAFPAP